MSLNVGLAIPGEGAMNLLAPRTLADELTPRDRELLEGMGNCYSVCGESFEETVRMVANARGRTPEEVKETLTKVAKAHRNDSDYALLRSRLPRDFPF